MHIITKAMKLFSLPLITLLLANVLLHAQAPTTWVIGTQYNSGSIVGYEDNFYRAIQDVPGSVGGTPDTLTDYWVDIFSTKPTVDPEDPPTTEPDTSDSDLGNLTPPEDNSSNDDPSGLPSASTSSFVKQQYLDLLGREAAESGLNFWTNKIDTGLASRADLVNEFVFSNEFQDKIAPISRLYQAYFLRIPNTSGLTFWVNQKINGVSLEDISSEFSNSEEFNNRYGDLTNEDFVKQIYDNVQGREGTESGISFWTNVLNSGTSRGSVMLEFSESGEYKTKTLSGVRVIGFYYGLLRRSPAQDGYDFWKQKLDWEISPNSLIDGFLTSAEYAARF